MLAIKRHIFIFFCSFFITLTYADSPFGIDIGYAGGPFDLENTHQSQGTRLAIDYYWQGETPEDWQFFAQGSAAFYHSEYQPLKSGYTDNLQIFAVAPVLRYFILSSADINPFIEISIGPGYLSSKHYENRNFGMYFTWQDVLGVGTTFGKKNQYTMELQMIHYSNAGLNTNNSGLTTPVLLSASYHF